MRHHARRKAAHRPRWIVVASVSVAVAAIGAGAVYWYWAAHTKSVPAAHRTPMPAPPEVRALLSSPPDPQPSLSVSSLPARVATPLSTPARASGLAATWTFQDAVSGNALKIGTVAQVPAGLLVDATSGKVLWSKNHRQKMEIASMTKMMTLLLALEAIKAGKLSLDTKVTVSRSAALTGGSQVYLKQGEVFTMGELLKSVTIKSANDSAQLVAETVGGDAATFVKRMNARARELNMTQTVFHNAHGLNVGSRNTSTALDMALLARELLRHPLVLQWSSSRTETFRNGTFQMRNSNPLVGIVQGVDGLKTGYYRQAGYCITFTVQRDGRRMIGVAIGVQSKTVRTAFCKSVIEWGYRSGTEGEKVRR